MPKLWFSGPTHYGEIINFINQKELEMDRYLQRNTQKYIYFICLHVTIHLYFYPYTLLHQIIVCTYMEVMCEPEHVTWA